MRKIIFGIWMSSLLIFPVQANHNTGVVNLERLEEAAQKLEENIQFAKANQAATPQLIYGLENVLFSLRQTLDSAGAQGAAEEGEVPRALPVQEAPAGGVWGAPVQQTTVVESAPQISRDIPDRRRWDILGTFQNAHNLKDKDTRTRSDSGTAHYKGQQVTADLHGVYLVCKVVQDHGQSSEDYPGAYKVEVSQDGYTWLEVFQSSGTPGHSLAQFPEVGARYVRITATRDRDGGHFWSIHELGIE